MNLDFNKVLVGSFPAGWIPLFVLTCLKKEGYR